MELFFHRNSFRNLTQKITQRGRQRGPCLPLRSATVEVRRTVVVRSWFRKIWATGAPDNRASRKRFVKKTTHEATGQSDIQALPTVPHRRVSCETHSVVVSRPLDSRCVAILEAKGNRKTRCPRSRTTYRECKDKSSGRRKHEVPDEPPPPLHPLPPAKQRYLFGGYHLHVVSFLRRDTQLVTTSVEGRCGRAHFSHGVHAL